MKSRIPVLAALAVLACLGATQAPVKLAWKPVAGSQIKYKITMNANMDVGMGPTEMKFGMVMAHKIVKTQPNGHTVVEETTSDISILFGGQDMSAMGAGMAGTVTLTMGPNYELISRKSTLPPEAENPRLENSIGFVFPKTEVKPGDTWTRKVEADPKTGAVAAEAVYKYEGAENVDGKWQSQKITYLYKETVGATPLTVTGTLWIAASDGELVKGDFALKNLELQPGMPPIEATSKVFRIG